jgi:hypothetical protein
VSSVFLVGRLEADPVVEGATCTLRVTAAAEEHAVHVTGEGVPVCARLRRGAVVGLEGRAVGERRFVAARVRAIRSRP